MRERVHASGIWPRWPAVAAIAAVLGVLLLPHAGMLPGGVYSDIGVAHLPQIFYLRRALERWHTFPLWAPTYYSGYPFYADPLAEIWYPPAWLMVVLPLPWGLWAALGLHLFWSALGMFALLRVWGRTRSSALFGALAWVLLPKIWAHWGAGHISLLFAVSWTPWLLLAVERRSRWLNAAAVWALTFLADPRWAAYAGILWVLWEVLRSPRLPKAGKKSLIPQSLIPNSLIPNSLIPLLLASPLAIPLLHYSHLSTRAALTPQDVLRFSLVPWRLVGLVLPPMKWFHEWVIYLGAALVLLALVAWVRGRARIWLWVALAAVVWSLGSYLPGMALIARLPLVNLLRVPPRVMFLFGFAFVVAAAEGLDVFLRAGKTSIGQRTRFAFFLLSAGVGFLGFALLLVAGMRREAALVLAIWLGSFGLFAADFPENWRAPLWLFLMLADLLVVDARLVPVSPFSEAFVVPSAVEKAVEDVHPPFRIYSPSYSVPQQAAAAFGWELANGVDPLVLESYAKFMQKASGVPDEGYSVVIPPLKDGYRMANAGYSPNAALLGLLNVRIVVAHFPVRAEGLELAARDSDVWVYRNARAKPRVWMERSGSEPSDARLDCWCPNRLRAHAVGAGLLVFSEVVYPGWQAFVDGKRVPLQTTHDILRAVPIPAGAHLVELRFRPWDLTLGLLLGAVGLLAWLFSGKMQT